MVYKAIIPSGMVGLVQVTWTVVVLILATALMTGGLEAVEIVNIINYTGTECLIAIPD